MAYLKIYEYEKIVTDFKLAVKIMTSKTSDTFSEILSAPAEPLYKQNNLILQNRTQFFCHVHKVQNLNESKFHRDQVTKFFDP